MSVTINYNKNSSKKNSSNLIIFTDENINISALKKHISSSDFSFIADLIKTKDIKVNSIDRIEPNIGISSSEINFSNNFDYINNVPEDILLSTLGTNIKCFNKSRCVNKTF